MKIKKFVSLLLAFILTITSTINSSAMGSGAESESDGSLSDIVFPERISIDSDLEENIKQNIRRAQHLLQEVDQSDARMAELREIYIRNKTELDSLSESLLRARTERDDYRRSLGIALEALDKFRNDILFSECGGVANPIDEARTLISGDIIPVPSSSILRSKRFYKGMTAGAIIVLALLIGMHLCLHYIHLPFESE